jgi:hypothetical protein
MDRRTVLLIILTVVLIATGMYNFYYFSGRHKPRPAAAAHGSRLATTTKRINRSSEESIQKVSLKTNPQNLYSTLPEGWGRNPFLTPAEINQIRASKNPFPVRPLPEYVVTSILISGSQKVAVIDGKIVGLGDPIGRETVNEISTEGVKLVMEGNLRTIKLRQGRTEIRTRIP